MSKKVNIAEIVYFTCVLDTPVNKIKIKNSEHFLVRGFLDGGL
jgi:hypothetical protein